MNKNLQHRTSYAQTSVATSTDHIQQDELQSLTDEQIALAQYRYDVIEPALPHSKKSAKRAAAINEIVKQSSVTRATVYNWLNRYEANGLLGLTNKKRKDDGCIRVQVSRRWDTFFASLLTKEQQTHIAESLHKFIREQWKKNVGWRTIVQAATKKLIELSRNTNHVAITTMSDEQLTDICRLNRRSVENEK